MNKNKIIQLLLLMLLGGISTAFSQKKAQVVTIEVSGSVTDEFGSPLEGVLVMNTDRQISVSDVEGNFSISSKVQDYISIEKEGFDRVITTVKDGKLINNKMLMYRTGFMNPDEVLEIPFGKVNTLRSTGSVIKVSGEQLQKHPSGLVYEALAGLIPGLRVQQTGSRPGLETYSMTYHGASVLVLVDGMPVTENLGLLEIDEVVFMRGASATAYMGEIGANGLLSIKTKRGIAGPRKITAQAEVSVGLPTSFVEMQNAYEYAKTINNALISDGLSPFYDTDALNAYQNHTDPAKYPDVNYRDEIYRDYITRQQYSAQVVGGDENTQYFANFTYNGLEGMENSPNRRHNDDFKFRSNLDIRLSDFMKMDIGLNGAYKDQTTTAIGSGSTMSNVNSIPANAFPLMLGDSIYITSQQYGTNLLYEMQEGGYNNKTNRVMGVNIGLDFDLNQILEGLSVNIRGTGDAWNQSELALNNNGDEYELVFETLSDGSDTMIINQTAWADPQLNPSNEGTSVTRQYNFSGQLAYSNTFDKHAIDAGLLAYLYQFDSDNNNINRFVSQSYNMRANYSYDNKYTAEVILNYSGTNKFEDENKYKLLPTLGAAWVISEEDFLAGSSVDYLKLRGSWGQQGYLTSFSNYYSFLGRWGITDLDALTGIQGNSSSTTTAYLRQTPSTGLDWPVKTSINLGLDGLFLNNSLSVQLDYFHNRMSDLIVRGVTMDLAGGSAYYAYSNQNQEDGDALELGLNYNNSLGNFRYAIGANVGYFKSVRTNYAEPDYTNTSELREGDATDAIYGMVDNGLFASDAEALASNQHLGSVYANDIIYQDINGDETVDNRDTKAIGNSDPRINYGININLMYKAFSLYLNGAGLAGYDINLNGNSQYQYSGFDNRPTHADDALPNGNVNTRLTVLGSDNNYRNSTYWLVSGNHFRLKNVELAYTLPSKYARNIFVSNAKVFVRGKNLLMISKFKNSDPEYMGAGYTDYPLFREFSMGLNFSF